MMNAAYAEGNDKDRLSKPTNVGVYDSTIKVLIVDDHALMRQMMGDVLTLDDEIEVIARAKDGAEALALLERITPDVIVLDFAMPGANGIDVIAEIRERWDQPVLMVSIHAQPYLVQKARRAGAQGYLPKLSLAHSLAPAIHAVCEGRSYFGEDNRWSMQA
jgi:DNA-binding NarL/FixJ family response regulator